ncbi:MAG: metallothiol transferase FosB [Janthinobacterium lividum]
MSIPIRGINHITFSVSSLAKSIAFYQSVFEATLLLQSENMAYFDVGGLWLALNVQPGIPRQEIKQSYTHLAFTVDASDLREMKKKLKRIGVELLPGRIREDGEGQSLYFHDPDGHLLEFHTGTLETRMQIYRTDPDLVTFPDKEATSHGN